MQLGDLLEDGPRDAPVAPVGGPFASAWRNYIKSVFKKGLMYKLSCNPLSILYIAENKTLAGKEDRIYEGEALGRKMAVVFFEDMPGGLVRRVHRETMGMQQILLSIAEALQTLAGHLIPADPERTAAHTELLLESEYEHLEIMRYHCSVEPGAPEAHVFHLDDEKHADIALAAEVPAEHRTKMILARSLQRNGELLDEENVQGAWNKTIAALKVRTAHLLPAAPPAPVAPAAPVAPPAGRGRRGRGRGRGRCTG